MTDYETRFWEANPHLAKSRDFVAQARALAQQMAEEPSPTYMSRSLHTYPKKVAAYGEAIAALGKLAEVVCCE